MAAGLPSNSSRLQQLTIDRLTMQDLCVTDGTFTEHFLLANLPPVHPFRSETQDAQIGQE
jgi:hypothetical protein